MAMSYLDYRVRHREHQNEKNIGKPKADPATNSTAGPSASAIAKGAGDSAPAVAKETEASAPGSFLDYKVQKRQEQVKQNGYERNGTYRFGYSSPLSNKLEPKTPQTLFDLSQEVTVPTEIMKNRMTGIIAQNDDRRAKQETELWDKRAAAKPMSMSEDSPLGKLSKKLGFAPKEVRTVNDWMQGQTVGELTHEFVNDPANKTYDADTVKEYNRIYDSEGAGAAQKYIMSKSNTNHPGMERVDAALLGAAGGTGLTSLAGLIGGRDVYEPIARETQRLQEAHPIASAGGSIAGNIALMNTIGGVIGKGATSLAANNIANPTSLRIGSSALNFALTTAAQQAGAVRSGLVKGSDYARNILVSGAGGAASSVASMIVGSGIEDFLVKTRSQTKFLDYVKNVTSASAGAAARIGIDYIAEDKKPTGAFRTYYVASHPNATEEEIQKAYNNALVHQAGVQFATAFAMNLFSSYMDTYKTSQANYQNLKKAYENLEKNMEYYSAHRPTNGEDILEWQAQVNRETGRLRAELSRNYFGGQQKNIDMMLDALDEIDLRAAQLASMWNGIPNPSSTADVSNATPSPDFTAAVDNAMKQGAAEAAQTPAPVSSGMDKLREIAGIEPESTPEVKPASDEIEPGVAPILPSTAPVAPSTDTEAPSTDTSTPAPQERVRSKEAQEWLDEIDRYINEEDDIPQEPVAEVPDEEQPVAEKPVAEQPVEEKPVAEQPVVKQEPEKPSDKLKELAEEAFGETAEQEPPAVEPPVKEAETAEKPAPVPAPQESAKPVEAKPAAEQPAPVTEDTLGIDYRAKAYPEGAAEIYKKHAEGIDDILSYDENMRKAYEAGKDGVSLVSTMENDDAFGDFYTAHQDAVDEMFNEGYKVWINRKNAPLNPPAADSKIESTGKGTGKKVSFNDIRVASNSIFKSALKRNLSTASKSIIGDDGRQYFTDGYVAVVLNDPVDGIPQTNDQASRPLVDLIGKELGKARNQGGGLHADYASFHKAVGTLKNTKMTEYNGMKLFSFDGHEFFDFGPTAQAVNPKRLETILRMLDNPSLYYGDGTKNPIYIKADNGEALLYPVNADHAKKFLYGNDNGQSEKPAAEAKPKPEKGTEVKTEEKAGTPQAQIADAVKAMIADGKSFSTGWLFDVANKAYGGTMAEGKYTVKDAYDGMELAINKYLMDADFVKKGNGSLADAKHTMTDILRMMKNIPTQTKRTEEQESFQQYSTPPNIAYAAARLANINPNDVVLEPSAGIGGLALWGKAWGATVYGNELSERRLAFLNELGLDGTFNENAEQINNVLPDNIKPTVVIMNPPFSATAGRLKKNNTKNATRHIEQALDRLQDGGRLVAILGRGMSDDSPSFKGWWNDLRKDYTIRANVRIDGSNYAKYGTTFDDQLVVIDKVGTQTGETLTGEYKSLIDLITDLEEVRDARQPLQPVSENNESGVLVQGGRDSSGRGNRVPVGRGDDSGRNGGVAPVRGSGTAGSPGRTGTGDRSGLRTGSNAENPVGSERTGNGVPGGRAGENGGGDSERNNDSLRLVHGSVQRTRLKPKVNLDSAFTEYTPAKVNIAGAKPHPGKLAESAAMGAVAPPDPTYTPHLPQELIDKGALSSAQLENIVYAGQAHSQMLPDGNRKGYFIGDGTGVGKGRQLSAIILDNFNQGRTKALWISKNKDLFPDAQRDWKDLGGDPNEVYDLGKIKPAADIPYDRGILFGTYNTLGSRKEAGIEKLKKWLGPDFDGVIAMDEAHGMANGVPTKGTRGSKPAAEKALWGIELQNAFPKARVVYASATGASSPANMAYLPRLGLWGKGTAFTDFNDFYSKISDGGLAAMELVARDMKAMGVYLARSISYDDVTYDTIEHQLTPIQTEIYNKMSDAWQIVLQNIEEALRITGQDKDGKARGTTASAFWGGLQRFYNQVITSMSMPSVIADIRKELDNGRSVLLQLTNTNEAQANRAIAKNAEQGGDLEDLDLTPSETLISLLEKSFPIQAYEEYADENGNIKSRPIFDKEGNPVIDKKAVALRDKLIEEVGLMQVPDGPLEMLLDAFGTDNVAEVTGRSRRVVYKKQSDGSVKRVIEKRNNASGLADAQAFQDGKKRILVFSEKGGTGKSYHADLRAKNQQQRVHYLLQPGWKADAAIQGLGRSHRTNQASAPIYKLVTTNVMGQKRFTSTIARRLNQMGALTKGQRDAGSGVFSEKDNLENPIAMDALSRYYRTADKALLKKLGIKIYDSNGQINESAPDLRNISKFLNRILALNVEEQNQVFDDFYANFEQMMDAAIANGTVDRGMESFKADKIDLVDEKVVRKDATGADTKYVQMTVYNKPQVISYSALKSAHRGYMGIYRLDDGSVRAVYDIGNVTDQNGSVSRKFRLDSPAKGKYSIFVEKTLKDRTTKLPESEWKTAWEEETRKLPKYNESTLHLLTGTLLPIWNKLPTNNTRVMRVVTSDGKQYLGRVINPDQIDGVLRTLGSNRTVRQYTPKEVYSEVYDNGKEAALRDNKWKINRRKVSGEWRLEVTGNNIWSLPKYVPGIITEKIGFQNRYFVPTGASGEKVLTDLLSMNPVVDVRNAATGDDIREMRAAGTASTGDPKQWTASRVGDTNKAPKPISDIIAQMRHDFGFNVTVGHIRRSGVQGTFNIRDKGIRTRIANNLPTVSHEFGHWLDDKYGITSSKEMPGSVRKELEAVFNKVLGANGEAYAKKDVIPEGMAEYIRQYLQNREVAAIDYPELTKYVLGSLDPNDLAKLSTFADEINAYYSLDAGSAASSIRLKEQGGPDFRTRGEKLQDANDKFQQAWIDSNYSIKRFTKENGGDAYTYAVNSAYSDAVAARLLEGDLTDIHGQYVSGGLRSALHGINTRDPKEYIAFNEYLIVRHGPEWLATNKRVFADDRKNSTLWMNQRRMELEAQYPEFEAASERLYEFIRNFTQTWGVDTGLISQETMDTLNEQYPNYVPFNRAVPIERRGKGVSRGFANQRSPLRAARGSGLDIIAPVDNIIDMVVTYTNVASRNRVMQAMRNVAIKEGDATWMEKVPMPIRKQTFNMGGVKETLREYAFMGMADGNIDQDAFRFAAGLIDQINDDMVKYVEGFAKGDVVTVMVDGKREYWKINDPGLLESLTNLSNPTLSGLLSVYARTSRFLTMNLTGNNPIWGISNLIRDYGTYSNYTPNRNLVSRLSMIGETYVNAFKNRYRDGKGIDPIYYEYLAMGGGTGSAYTADINLAERVRNEYGRSFWKRAASKYNPVDFLSFMMDTIEQGPRFATYKYCRTVMGMSPEDSLYASKDVTVNFRKFGTMGRQMNAAMPFSNAAVQGLDKMVRYFTAEDVNGGSRERSKAAAERWSRWVAGSVVAMLVPYLWNKRNKESREAYTRLSNYTKNNYFCWYVGNDRFLTLPKPRELASITTALERTADYAQGDQFAFKEFDEYVADVFFPDIISDIAQIPGNIMDHGSDAALKSGMFQILGDFGIAGVAAQVAANKNFLESPIESQANQNLLPKDRYTGATSKMAYWIGRGLGLSPQSVDHFAKNTLGYMWKIPAALFTVDPAKSDPSLGMKNSYVRDSLYSNDIVNRMYEEAEWSAMDAKSNPNDGKKQVLGKLDSNMTSFYGTYNALEKAKGEDRTARRDILRMIDAYQRAPESKATNKAQEMVYDLARKTRDTDLLPGVMTGEVKDSEGKKHQLSPAQYIRYQKEYDAQYWKGIEQNVYSGAGVQEKTHMIEAVKELAKQKALKYALGMVGAEYKAPGKSSMAYFENGGTDLGKWTEFDSAIEAGNQDGGAEWLNSRSDIGRDEALELWLSYGYAEKTFDKKVNK